MADKKMLIGVNTHFDKVCRDDPQFLCAAHGGNGVDFMVCHTDPHRVTLEQANENARKADEILTGLGIKYLVNFEYQNFNHEAEGPDGVEWVYNTDTLHRVNIPDEYMAALSSGKGFEGIVYDELEHAIINRNLSIALASKGKIRKNVFTPADTFHPKAQGDLLSEQIGEFAADIKSKGAKYFAGEHVMPVLYHTFARNGVIPNFKSQKESCSDIQFAFAAGAALQYGTELFNCVDSWFRISHPGHPPKEMYSNLEFAYYAGVNRVYVESTSVFTDEENRITEYGKKFNEFSQNYRGKERSYDISDYRPEIGIIRFDDTYWGQGDPFLWNNNLFGNPDIKPGPHSKEITKIFSVLTHGETSPSSFSWDKVTPSSLRKHRSFVTLNSVAVFDDKVELKTLESLKLCFLTGIHISSETLAAVRKLVEENGLTVVAPQHFVPSDVLKEATYDLSVVRRGKGKWIVTDDPCSDKVKTAVAPFIGKKGEIRLTFANTEVKMQISADGETLTNIEQDDINV